MFARMSVRLWILWSLLAVIVLASCVTPDLSRQSGGPVPPFGSNTLSGRPTLSQPKVVVLEPLTLEQAQTCLSSGKAVYGVALQNSNVRVAPQTDACRIGRVPKGGLVQITGVLGAQELVAAAQTTVSAAVSPTAAIDAAPGPQIGYSEDIQPIFLRVCNSCHSAVVKTMGLQVTSFEGVMTGSITGTVVIPGDSANSKLWQMVGSGKMPLIGSLTDAEKQLVKDWIDAGAPERRPSVRPATTATTATTVDTGDSRLWLEIDKAGINPSPDQCAITAKVDQRVVNSELILPVSCGQPPQTASLAALRVKLGLAAAPAPAAAVAPAADASAAPASVAAAAAPAAAPALAAANASDVGLQTPALGLPAASDGDGWLTPRGGFCIQRRLPDNTRGITSLAFAPDGRLFIGFDSNIVGESDPMILFDAYHPSRAIAVMDSATDSGLAELLVESSRVTGLAWSNGMLFVSRAGEVGVIPDGGAYTPLAGGFAVTSRLFHANNGIVVAGGWVYVSAGGVIDGYSDGPIVGIGEAGAQQVVSGGNALAARIVRAPTDRLLSERSSAAFSTAARGVRNPYGITVDPSGRLWFTDNGATNLPEDISAGDEVNLLNPGAIGGSEDATPYYGFPLALNGSPPDWYTKPVVTLANTSAPTGITWAYGTIFYGQYGRNPGLYRLGRSADGRIVSERIMLAWPVLAVTTAPDGALWVGMGDGGLYRMTPGCGG